MDSPSSSTQPLRYTRRLYPVGDDLDRIDRLRNGHSAATVAYQHDVTQVAFDDQAAHRFCGLPVPDIRPDILTMARQLRRVRDVAQLFQASADAVPRRPVMPVPVQQNEGRHTGETHTQADSAASVTARAEA